VNLSDQAKKGIKAK